MPKQGHKKQKHDDKQKIVAQKDHAETAKKKVATPKQVRQEEQFYKFKMKKKEEYYKYKQSVCSDPGEKDKSVNSD